MIVVIWLGMKLRDAVEENRKIRIYRGEEELRMILKKDEGEMERKDVNLLQIIETGIMIKDILETGNLPREKDAENLIDAIDDMTITNPGIHTGEEIITKILIPESKK